MNSPEKKSPRLKITFGITETWMLFIPVTALIWSSLVILIGDHPWIVVPTGILVHVALFFLIKNFWSRYYFIRYIFFDECLEVKFLLASHRNFILNYNNVSHISWKFHFISSRGGRCSRFYFMILHPKESHQIQNANKALWWNLFHGRKYPRGLPPGYCIDMSVCDIQTIEDLLKEKFNFDWDQLPSIYKRNGEAV
jgi:hypothetical protein